MSIIPQYSVSMLLLKKGFAHTLNTIWVHTEKNNSVPFSGLTFCLRKRPKRTEKCNSSSDIFWENEIMRKTMIKTILVNCLP